MSTVFVAYCHFGVALLTVISSGLGSIPLDEISDGTLKMHLVRIQFSPELAQTIEGFLQILDGVVEISGLLIDHDRVGHPVS